MTERQNNGQSELECDRYELPSGRDFVWQLLFSCICGFVVVAILYPGFLFFTQYPMQAFGQELQDPVAGYLNFIPGLRVFVFELLHNKNFLWSNLRGFGLPILGHDIQIGPLFPLTWLSLFIPEPYFWNIMIICRLILLFSGTYLVAFYLFSLQRLGALLFALTFVFNIFVLRWLNHPWQNGLLAGIWYLLFLGLTVRFSSEQKKRTVPFWLFFSLVVSIYCMVTNGFPEEAMLFALLIVLLFPFLVLAQWQCSKVDLKRLLKILIAAHLLGFALSSLQIVAFFEFLHSRDDIGCRRSLSALQMKLDEIIPFLWMNAVDWGQKYGELHKSSIGLTVLFLGSMGIMSRFIRPIRMCWLDIGIILPLLFYFLKNFPVFPPINSFIGSLPLINELRFNVYCFPYVQIFFSYYAAVGLQFIISNDLKKQKKIIIYLISSLLTVIIIILSARKFNINFFINISNKSLNQNLITLYILILILFITFLAILKNKYQKIFSSLIIALVLAEILNTRMVDFVPMITFSESYLHHTTWASSLSKALTREQLHRQELRSNDKYGRYLAAGIATVDHGAPAVISKRNLLLRRAIYDGPWRGFLELKTPKVPFADDIIGRNLISDNIYRGAKYGPDWDELHRQQENIRGNIDGIENLSALSSLEYKYLGKGILKFSGWALSGNFPPDEQEYYFLLKGNAEQFVIPVWRVKRHDIAISFNNPNYKNSGWIVRIDPTILHEREYRLELRLVDGKQRAYSIMNLGTLIISQPHKKSENLVYWEIDSIKGTHCHIRNNALSRAYIAGSCVAVATPEIATQFMQKGQYRKGVVYLENLNAEEKEFCHQQNRQWQQVPIKEDRGSIVELKSVHGPGVLVLSDTYYSGWHAYDVETGRELQIKPANIAFQGILLPDNRKYTIIFRYRPQWLSVTFLLTVVSLFILVMYGIIEFQQKRREK